MYCGILFYMTIFQENQTICDTVISFMSICSVLENFEVLDKSVRFYEQSMHNPEGNIDVANLMFSI